MAQQLQALTALEEHSHLVPRTYTAAPSGLWFQFQGISHPLLASVSTRHTHGTFTYVQATADMHN